MPDLYKGFRNHPKDTNPEVAVALFAETLENLQNSIWLIPESQVRTLNSRYENLRIRRSALLNVYNG
jgi:hypothetical protein